MVCVSHHGCRHCLPDSRVTKLLCYSCKWKEAVFINIIFPTTCSLCDCALCDCKLRCWWRSPAIILMDCIDGLVVLWWCPHKLTFRQYFVWVQRWSSSACTQGCPLWWVNLLGRSSPYMPSPLDGCDGWSCHSHLDRRLCLFKLSLLWGLIRVTNPPAPPFLLSGNIS